MIGQATTSACVHETVIAVQPPHVRCRSRSGKHVFGESFSPFDPMYGPAVRCKRFCRAGVSGLASMYPASDWSMCSGPSWISAPMRSHYRTGLNGPFFNRVTAFSVQLVDLSGKGSELPSG